MTLTDRVMEHGAQPRRPRALDLRGDAGLQPRRRLPGRGLPAAWCRRRELVGTDVAWLVQPYMAFLGAVLALSLWALAAPLVESRPMRAAVAFIACAVGAAVRLLPLGRDQGDGGRCPDRRLRRRLREADRGAVPAGARAPLGLLAAALIGVLDVGGVLWLAPALVLVSGARAPDPRPARGRARRAALLAGMLIALSIPVLTSGGLLPPTSSPLTDAAAKGNLIEPLEPAQVAGIWPAGDFRIDPDEGGSAYVLIAVAVGAAIAGLLVAWRRRAWALARLRRRHPAGLLRALSRSARPGSRARRWRRRRRRSRSRRGSHSPGCSPRAAGSRGPCSRRRWPEGCCGRTCSPTATSTSRLAISSPSSRRSATRWRGRARR